MYTLKISNRKFKRFVMILPNKKKVHFGDIRYSNYTKHKDKKRKRAYIARHSKLKNWNKKNTAAYFSRYILWNKRTIRASVKDLEKKLNAKISTKFLYNN